ncbi:MAG: hypothetical protein LBI55_02220 [Oscillospiraceae bacterium]|jgi:chromosome segregation ATPase|nr:hypothetical protein [Oscillospiraceae bacterium]
MANMKIVGKRQKKSRLGENVKLLGKKGIVACLSAAVFLSMGEGFSKNVDSFADGYKYDIFLSSELGCGVNKSRIVVYRSFPKRKEIGAKNEAVARKSVNYPATFSNVLEVKGVEVCFEKKANDSFVDGYCFGDLKAKKILTKGGKTKIVISEGQRVLAAFEVSENKITRLNIDKRKNGDERERKQLLKAREKSYFNKWRMLSFKKYKEENNQFKRQIKTVKDQAKQRGKTTWEEKFNEIKQQLESTRQELIGARKEKEQLRSQIEEIRSENKKNNQQWKIEKQKITEESKATENKLKKEADEQRELRSKSEKEKLDLNAKVKFVTQEINSHKNESKKLKTEIKSLRNEYSAKKKELEKAKTDFENQKNCLESSLKEFDRRLKEEMEKSKQLIEENNKLKKKINKQKSNYDTNKTIERLKVTNRIAQEALDEE